MLTDIKCPECGSRMFEWTEKMGPNRGQRSYLCLNYPECKGKIPLAEQSDSIDIKRIQVQAFSTLGGHLLFQHTGDLLETDFLGGQYLRYGRLITVCISIFDTGMILGRARRDKMNYLAKTFAISGRSDDEFVKLIQETAKLRLEQFGQEPDSLSDYIIRTELEKIGLSLTDSKVKNIKKAFMRKCTLDLVGKKLEDRLYEGIGFGSSFPELTEKLWNNTYKSIDSDKWSEYRDLGLVLLERPPNVTLIDREKVVLRLVADFVEERYPELMDPLELR